MKRRNRRAYGLIVVLIVLALVSGSIIVLTQVSGMMVFRTRQMYLEARTRDLQASARAWAELNARSQAEGTEPRTIALDTKPLAAPGAELRVTISRPEGKPVGAAVQSACGTGRRVLRRRGAFSLEDGRK
ncbi:MAG TPA: hypothetical protein VNA25_06370 [Phycisphaerae bacterium]|nr:hypothetical protein [Phycisphaerae bacterium]